MQNIGDNKSKLSCKVLATNDEHTINKMLGFIQSQYAAILI